MRLPRVSHRRRAAAELRRHRAVRDAQHPRGLSTARIRLRLRARRAFRDRSHAPCVRRPQSPARRPGVRRATRPEQLLDKSYAETLRAQIDPQRAGNSAQLKPGIAAREGTHTTHYSIADRFGNAVAVTYTLNDWFGARVTAAGTGVLLNNEMDDFTAKAGVANMYGLVQSDTNKIEPGKRPLSSMTPTIVTRDGKPWMILGTPGGSRIITAVMQTMLNVIDYDMDLQEAVDAPRIHQQWLPEETYVEARALSPDTRALLVAMGHKLIAPQPENHVAAILIGAPALECEAGQRNDFLRRALDPRRNTGLALGY